MDRTLALLHPGEDETCLRFVDISVRVGWMDLDEAQEWRRRIAAWVAFQELAERQVADLEFELAGR